MCTGIEIASLVASLATAAAGAGVSMYGANKAQNEATINAARIADARNKSLAELVTKNDALAAESRNAYQMRETEIQPAPLQQRGEDLTAQRTGALESAVGPSSDVPLSGSAPQVVQSAAAKKLLDATNKAKTGAQALGTLGGYGDLWFDQGLANQDAGRDIGMFDNFIKGNMSIAPYLQDYAGYSASRPSSGIGEMFQAAGNVIGAAAPSVGGAVGKRGGFMPAKTSTFPVPMG